MRTHEPVHLWREPRGRTAPVAVALLCLLLGGCVKRPDGYDDDESVDPCAGIAGLGGGWVDGCGPPPDATPGVCLESMASPIRCSAFEPNNPSSFALYRNACESLDDDYHRYDWLEECPRGADAGCRAYDAFRGAAVTEWVYHGATCLGGGDPVMPPAESQREGNDDGT